MHVKICVEFIMQLLLEQLIIRWLYASLLNSTASLMEYTHLDIGPSIHKNL